MAPPRIVVVEDDAIIGKHIQNTLRALGYEVAADFNTGEAAVAGLEAARPDLVLMDVSLAGSLSGIEAAERIRDRLDVPIIYLTAYADSNLFERAKITDPFGYLIKPFEPRALHATIEMALHKHALAVRLRESEARYRAVVENAIEGIVLYDPQTGRVVECNAAMCQFLGYTPDELKQLAAHEILDLEADDVLRLQQEALERGGLRLEEVYGRRKDGTLVPAEISAVAIRYAGQAMISAVVRDLSARKQAEAEIRARQHFLAELNQLAQAALSSSDMASTLELLAQRMTRLHQADRCCIALAGDQAAPLRLAALHAPTPPANSLPWHETSEGCLAADALAAAHPIAVPDVDHSVYAAAPLRPLLPCRSLLALPLTADARGLGAVVVGFDRPHAFTPDELARGEQAAGQIALAIAKLQLLEAERQTTAQLTRANSFLTALSHVATRVVMSASDPGGVMQTLGLELKQLDTECLVALHEPASDDLIIHYLSLEPVRLAAVEASLGGPVVGRRLAVREFPLYQALMEAGRAQFVESPLELADALLYNAPHGQVRSVLALVGAPPGTRGLYLPLRIEERVIGLLVLWGAGLQANDTAPASVFASQIAIALENARLYAEVQQLAITDALTGLFNWRGLYELGQREVERALRYGRPLAAVMLDIDYFKDINDAHGHAVGNQVLAGLAARCRAQTRSIDLNARYGGEEFVLLLPETDGHTARSVAERLRRAVAATPIATSAGPVAITVSLGVALAGPHTPDLDALLAQADAALYAAKHAGRNRVAAAGEPQHGLAS